MELLWSIVVISFCSVCMVLPVESTGGRVCTKANAIRPSNRSDDSVFDNTLRLACQSGVIRLRKLVFRTLDKTLEGPFTSEELRNASKRCSHKISCNITVTDWHTMFYTADVFYCCDGISDTDFTHGSPQTQHAMSVGAVTGCVIAGIVSLIIAGGIVLLVYRRRTQQRRESEKGLQDNALSNDKQKDSINYITPTGTLSWAQKRLSENPNLYATINNAERYVTNKSQQCDVDLTRNTVDDYDRIDFSSKSQCRNSSYNTLSSVRVGPQSDVTYNTVSAERVCPPRAITFDTYSHTDTRSSTYTRNDTYYVVIPRQASRLTSDSRFEQCDQYSEETDVDNGYACIV